MSRYFDLHIQFEDDDVRSLTALAEVAGRYGYSGAVIMRHVDADAPYRPDKADNVQINHDFRFFYGVEIVAHNISELKAMIKKYRSGVDVIAVHGGDEKINRAALEKPGVDMLAHPEKGPSNGLNHVLARLATKNNIVIEFSINTLINSRGGERSRALAHMEDNLRLSRKYKSPVVLTSNARSIYGLRAPREMIALAGLFGMTREEGEEALSVAPAAILSI